MALVDHCQLLGCCRPQKRRQQRVDGEETGLLRLNPRGKLDRDNALRAQLRVKDGFLHGFGFLFCNPHDWIMRREIRGR